MAYTLLPLVPQSADTVLTLGKVIDTHAPPTSRSMVPRSPPMKPSLVEGAHTLVSVFCVGTVTLVHAVPFQR